MDVNESGFLPIYQGQMTYMFFSALHQKPCSIGAMSKEATLCSDSLTMYVSQFKLLEQSKAFVMKVFDYFTLQFTDKYNNRSDDSNSAISVSIKDMAYHFGEESDEASIIWFWARVIKSVKLLRAITVEWTETIDGNHKPHMYRHLCAYAYVRNGTVVIKFSNPYAFYLKRSPLLWYPGYLLGLNEENLDNYLEYRRFSVCNMSKVP